MEGLLLSNRRPSGEESMNRKNLLFYGSAIGISVLFLWEFIGLFDKHSALAIYYDLTPTSWNYIPLT
jgi:hypothetical protein